MIEKCFLVQLLNINKHNICIKNFIGKIPRTTHFINPALIKTIYSYYSRIYIYIYVKTKPFKHLND